MLYFVIYCFCCLYFVILFSLNINVKEFVLFFWFNVLILRDLGYEVFKIVI